MFTQFKAAVTGTLNSYYPPVLNRTLLPRSPSALRPLKSRFRHWLTSIALSHRQPRTTTSTPTLVTLTHPLTDRNSSFERWFPIDRSDGSDTADPQKARLRRVSCGRPSERTSVDVSERAQQKDWEMSAIDLIYHTVAAYQVQLPEAPCRLCETDDRIIAQISAVS